MKNQNLLIQLVRFAVVGVIAAIVDVGTLFIFREKLGIDVLISSALSFSISVVVNYILSMAFVFHGGKQTKGKEFVIFVLLSVGGLGINQFIMWLGTEFMAFYYLWVKIFAMIFVPVYNFITRKIFLEDKNR